MKFKMKYILPFSPFAIVIVSYIFALLLGVCDICHANDWGPFCSDTGSGYLFMLTTIILLPSAVLISGIWWFILWRETRKKKSNNIY